MMNDLRFPFTGKFRVTSLFGKRSTGIAGASTDHLGVDLVGIDNKNIVAVADGKVTKVDTLGNSKRGRFIWVSQVDGYGTIYQHLSEIYVIEGQQIKCGQLIAREGNSGKGFDPPIKSHLHFGVSKNPSYTETMKNRKANALNPLEYFNVNDPATALNRTLEGGEPIYYTNTITLEQLDIVWTDQKYKVADLKGASYDALYGRRYRIVIQLDNGQYMDVSSLRCKFEITQSYFNCDNQAIISIYNLTASDEARIVKNGTKIYVEAGYAGSIYGKIYEGNIFQVFRGKERGTDYILSIVAYISYDFSLYNVTNTTMIAEANLRDVVDTITKPIYQGQITDKLSEIKYPRGKVLFGSSNGLLNQIKRSEDLAYYLENGQVNLIDAKDVLPGEIIHLGPESGLLGAPSQTQQGITCSCLINPQIKLNSLFHLDNAKVQGMQMELGQYQVPLDTEGIYRAIKLVYIGDTRGDDWHINITALTQSGTLPTLADNYQTVIF